MLVDLLQKNSPTEVFGDNPDKQKREYRRLVRVLHPDTRDGSLDAKTADEIFHHLESLWNQLQGKVVQRDKWTIATKRNTYVVERGFDSRFVVNQYKAVRQQDGTEMSVAVRLPRSSKDNDLMEREIKALKAIAQNGDEHFVSFTPTFVESFKYRDGQTGIDRKGVIATDEVSGLISLAEVKQRMGDLDARDVAWMFRRLLMVLGNVHRCGVVQGSVLSENVFIQPEMHGLVLTSFVYSSMGEPIPVMTKGSLKHYPKEVQQKEAPTSATDIYMAASLAKDLIGSNLFQKTAEAKALRAFFAGVMLEKQTSRPQDAWSLLQEYDSLIERLWGKRKFRPFVVPQQ